MNVARWKALLATYALRNSNLENYKKNISLPRKPHCLAQVIATHNVIMKSKKRKKKKKEETLKKTTLVISNSVFSRGLCLIHKNHVHLHLNMNIL